MKLSRKWLQEFTPVSVSDREFGEAMTLSGSKVELTEVMGEDIQNIVVGQVLSMVRHENSDHMFICQLEVGQSAPVQIVTGAQNLQEGDFVPVALHDSHLPGGKHITAGELRGVASNGMLCSYQELGMTDLDWPHSVADGIFILQSDPDLVAQGLTPGEDVKSLLGLDDHVVEFEITPNRPDCLSVIGLAREAAATFGGPLALHTPAVKGGGPGNLADLLDVETPDPELCPRYTARMVRNVKIAPSPLWMRQRLRASGVRPINNIVDITNYVMLEYGQPMHAFDYRYVQGGKIIVRRAKAGEVLTTLDGSLRTLTDQMLVIADETRAVGLAGIMGGENSEIVPDTVDVVFESANFDGTCIRKGALTLGMRTEASAKFEKGLDPMNALPAVERACELVELLGAGEVVDGVIDLLNHVPHPTTLNLRPRKINELLGTEIPTAEMVGILESLGFNLAGEMVTVPSWRADVAHYSDLAEEVARFHGYNNIPVTLMGGQTTQGGYTPQQLLERELGRTCRSLGYDEIITYSFISPSYYDKIGWATDEPRRASLKILNPLGEDTSIMRTTTLPSLLEILARNYNNRNKLARLYEIGKIYLPRPDGLADEPRVLSLGAYGGELDFFTLKGAVEALLGANRVADLSYASCRDNPSYHPGRCAQVFAGDTLLGVLGQIHPAVAAHYGVEADLYCAELSLEGMMAARGAEPVYTPLPRFPSVMRDIAVVCDEGVSVGALSDCIRRGAKGLLKQVSLFDIYRGKGVDEGKKSVAFNLTLRSDEGSLTAEQADADVKSILEALSTELGAVLR